ncbi:MAG: HAD family hydrolase [Bdellovibrionales bacterium]
MKSLNQFQSRAVRVLLTDIDGTLTQDGRLPSVSYSSLCKLAASGVHVIPVTGRPAGWCELIARLWPVHGVVGENGAFYFRFDPLKKKLRRHFARDKNSRRQDRAKLKRIRTEVLATVPGAAIASDQFCRLFDLAIDFNEDVPPLAKSDIQKIVSLFKHHGAQAKVSNIHVNGWFGDYDKLSTCKVYLQHELELSEPEMKTSCAFIGDSPNDEPMFAFFPHSFAVANVREFLSDMKFKPAYVTQKSEGEGFAELANRLLILQSC